MDENLKPGRIVLYVLKNQQVRPLTVTHVVAASKSINGVLAFDGPNDRNNLPDDIEIRSETELRTGTRWLEDIPFHEIQAGKTMTPGTWHWPVIGAAVAA